MVTERKAVSKAYLPGPIILVHLSKVQRELSVWLNVRRPVSCVVCQQFAYEHCRGLNFHPICLKLAQNVCLEEISDEAQNGFGGFNK